MTAPAIRRNNRKYAYYSQQWVGYGKTLQQLMLVGWTFTELLTPVLMKLGEHLRKYAYGHIAFLLSTTFFKYGTGSSTEAKVKGQESCMWSECSTGAKFHGAKVLGTFTPEERKFHGTKVLGLLAPWEQMFHGMKVQREWKFYLWTFRSQKRKCRGTKSPDTIHWRLPDSARKQYWSQQSSGYGTQTVQRPWQLGRAS